MNYIDCARCGRPIESMGRRDDYDRYVHATTPCPPPPVSEASMEMRTRPYIISSSVRPFCRRDEHTRCAGVTITNDARANVCLCGCHHPNSPEQREV